MHPAGLKAFAARSAKKSGIYSYEQRKSAKFTREQEKQFRANKSAWEFFRSQAPWYQRVTTYWVISAKKSGIYSYEQRKSAKFTREQEKQFRANKSAWEFFRSQAPWHQRVTTYWVISARKEETKLKRLSVLIDHSHNRRTLPQLRLVKKK
jgi:uncharacterized protein YdeI (YjbR/CyaY-like superfamily)